MTERLYQHDAYLKEFNAQVIETTSDGVMLDCTAFFPSGGGVQGDEGTLTSQSGETYRVMETLDGEQGILHRLDRQGLRQGDAIKGALDWQRRFTLMRYHTATHVLTGIMFKDYGVRVTGNQLTPEKGRVDFAFETFDREALEEGFRRSNALVAQDLPVEISFVPAEEAKARPELFKLETAFHHDYSELRLVDIVNFDVQADGGCHVAKLSEIGKLVLTKSENKGKANRRVYFVLEQ
ncbi:MAG: alanyl-tRNA editing protein [SAR324 cluster bacterium]|nr:alanyl-tRNA editing protein [SAR324 cluster bacterium]MCZ6730845.1 alanyl-tRNA editing protein [SAR324 cluster bacterium]